MKKLENEIWTPVLGYIGLYEVSNYGRIKSLKRFNPKSGKGGRWYPERILKSRDDKDGYIVVGLTKNGKMKLCKIHRLVLSSFCGYDNDLHVNHIDGNKQNNHLDNLEWVTCSDNQKHAHKIGIKNQVGSRNNGSKLTEEKVLEIVELIKKGMTMRSIAKMYSVGDETIRHIKIRRTWNHVTKDIDF